MFAFNYTTIFRYCRNTWEERSNAGKRTPRGRRRYTLAMCDMKKTVSMDEAIREVRKENLKDLSGLSVMRLLVPIQHQLTRLLLWLPINARQVTVLWFVTALISFTISAIGSPWAFAVAALVYCLVILLDLSDGEVGRFRARWMTPEENLRTHVNGMYLDRLFHVIATPLWPLAIAVGLYRMSGRPEILFAGISLLAYHCARRSRSVLEVYLTAEFRAPVNKLVSHGQLSFSEPPPAQKRGFVRRCMDKLDFWLRNGKRFNTMVLLCAAIDCGLLVAYGPSMCWTLFGGFAIWGTLALLLLLDSFWSVATGTEALRSIVDVVADEHGRTSE